MAAGYRGGWSLFAPLFPSPLVGARRAKARSWVDRMSVSSFETGEGSVSADRDPSSAFPSGRHLLPQGEKGRKLRLRMPLSLRRGLRPIFVPQMPLHQFPGRRARQLRLEVDALRAFDR